MRFRCCLDETLPAHLATSSAEHCRISLRSVDSRKDEDAEVAEGRNAGLGQPKQRSRAREPPSQVRRALCLCACRLCCVAASSPLCRTGGRPSNVPFRASCVRASVVGLVPLWCMCVCRCDGPPPRFRAAQPAVSVSLAERSSTVLPAGRTRPALLAVPRATNNEQTIEALSTQNRAREAHPASRHRAPNTTKRGAHRTRTAHWTRTLTVMAL